MPTFNEFLKELKELCDKYIDIPEVPKGEKVDVKKAFFYPFKSKGIRCPNCNKKKIAETEEPNKYLCLKCNREFFNNE